MLQSIKNMISLLSLIVALDNGETININELGDELNKLINGRTDIEQLTFDELLVIMKILKQYISNAA